MARGFRRIHGNRMEKIEDKIYRLALEEHPEFKEIPVSELKSVIQTALLEIVELENAADLQKDLADLTPEVVEKIKALWVFSGPGTYNDVFIADRYKDYSWTRGMDHDRVAYAEWLYCNIMKINKNDPTVIYNGSDQQNAVLREVVRRGEIKIPNEKMLIIGENIQNTVDQIRTFILPKSLHKSEHEIGLVSHAPHLMRIAHTLNHFEIIPKDMTVRLFPIATVEDGKEEYAISEIKGLLYYIFLGKNAKSIAYPYII